MGILDRAIRRGITKAVGNTVQRTVEKAAAPIVEQTANQAARSVQRSLGEVANVGSNADYPNNATCAADSTEDPQTQAKQAASVLGGMFGGLYGTANSMANEAAKSMKICPSCGEAAGKEERFCPQCGAKLPDQTLSQGALCASCGKQNNVGTKFCSGCGAKLPAALAEENAQKQRDADTLAKWQTLLPAYPVWRMGGSAYALEEQDVDENGCVGYVFYAEGVSQSALAAYLTLLRDNGFCPAGRYPSEGVLYRRIGECCFCLNADDPFPGDAGKLHLYFYQREPVGGFDYRKAELKKTAGWRDLLGL